jgi:hypothetical protein
MVRMFKRFLLFAILALGMGRAAAFVILGPFETYQVAALTYGIYPVGPFFNFENTIPELGGPKNLGEEYRRNMPVLYYTFDSSFLEYFGSNGVAAVDEAFATMNSLTNVSYYSSDLSEWPMEAQAFNWRALALNLTDLKSFTMSMLVEQMGLGEPERFVWTLHDREVGPGGCPGDVSYLVIKRNFEPSFTGLDVLQPSSYVNGTLYSYFITEFCTGPWVADAVEFAVDPSANTFSAVASYSLPFGAYYTGLTRDDVGGLRYLLRTNNMNIEAAGESTFAFITNTTPQLLFTSNLTEFAIQALTNGPAALNALFPNLQIASSTPIFTNVVTSTTIFYFTNFPLDPVGSPAALVELEVLTTNVLTYFNHEFLNVYIRPGLQLVSNFQIPLVPGHSTTNGVLSLIVTNITASSCPPFTPVGSICTNVSIENFNTSFIFGDYFILPTNLCDVALVSTQLIRQITITNVTEVATNAPGTTNAANEFFSVTPTYTFKQYVYVVRPVECPTNAVALWQGIERVQFIRRDFDSLANRFFYPITNEYTMTMITNSTPRPQRIRRAVTAPDILIRAEDLATESPSASGFGSFPVQRNLIFRTNSTSPNLFGPGTLEVGVDFVYNKVGPLFGTFTPFNLDETSHIPLLTWGSFDGSTNLPVVYPNGTSTLNLETAVFIQVAPVYLPEGRVTSTPVQTNYYAGALGVTSYTPAFTPPVTWAMAPGSSGLPPGLALSTLNSTNGVISGVPTTTGTFDFVIRVTDSQARTTDRSYYIKVNP